MSAFNVTIYNIKRVPLFIRCWFGALARCRISDFNRKSEKNNLIFCQHYYTKYDDVLFGWVRVCVCT